MGNLEQGLEHENPTETGELTKEHLGEQEVEQEGEVVVVGRKGGERERFIEMEERVMIFSSINYAMGSAKN